ncbi:uncharacterized protein [Pocillopora verrucosa]|uniref:uncharacterized protein n=1 Tax=Pocillopora verrucosa TaxID=203993 RepID=UPI003341A9A8
MFVDLKSSSRSLTPFLQRVCYLYRASFKVCLPISTARKDGKKFKEKKFSSASKRRPCIWGSSVFWYPHQRAYCSAFKSWSGYVNAVVDIFFTKETLAISSARGSERKGKSGDANIPLTLLIIDALVGKVCSKFSKDSPQPSQIIQKINMKCVEARRPPRVREQRAE